MTDKDLRKLNRYQLLELLVIQTEHSDKLQSEIEELNGRLQERELNMSKMGSIAEASLQLCGVFETAQKAADYYVEAAQKRADEILEFARIQASSIIARAEAEARGILGAEHDVKTGERSAT